MTYCGYHHTDDRETRSEWSHVGRAAEDFARRVARDAIRFAERIEEHSREFARDLGREWRHGRRHGRHAGWDDRSSAEEVRHIFEDVRGIFDAVIDGVDELVARLFPEAGQAAETARQPEESPAWTRVVANREATCSGCQRLIAAGEDAYAQEADDGPVFRCATCGPLVTEGA
jgi:hypothetical protein